MRPKPAGLADLDGDRDDRLRSSGVRGRRAPRLRRRSHRPRPRRLGARGRGAPSPPGIGAASPTPSGRSPARVHAATPAPRSRASGWSAARRPRTRRSAACACGARSSPPSPTTAAHRPRTPSGRWPGASPAARRRRGSSTPRASAANRVVQTRLVVVEPGQQLRVGARVIPAGSRMRHPGTLPELDGYPI